MYENTDTVQALIDLSLPRFTKLEDGRLPKVRSWPVTDQPPSSPATSRDGGGYRTPSPFLQSDGLMTACLPGGPVRSDYRLPMSMDSSTPPTPMGSVLSNSDDDVPLRTDQNDRRKVQRRELNDDQPGPIEAPDQVPDVSPVPVDRVGSVSLCEAGQLSPEGVTPNRKMRPITLIRKPIPRLKMNHDKPYGLRSKDKPHEVRGARDAPVEGWEYEVSHNEPPLDLTASDTMIRDDPVSDPKSVARPVLVKMKVPRLLRHQEKLQLTTTESASVSKLGLIANRESVVETPALTSEAAGSDVPLLPQRVVAKENADLMTDRGPDAETASTTLTPPGMVLSPPVRQLHQPPPPSEAPDWSDGEGMQLVIVENPPVPSTPKQNDDGILVSSADVVSTSLRLDSSQEPGTLSTPLSPNRVRTGHSQDMPAEGSIFDVSPDLPGFNMRPAGGGVQQLMNTLPPANYVGFDNPFFGSPIAYAQCQNTSGMDTTTTLPVYNIPRNCHIGVDQSSVPTVFASGVSADSIPWSTAEEIIRDIAREGPFDVGTTPMDTEVSPQICSSLPGCPFRMTSYTPPPPGDTDARYGLQLHHPRFLEFVGAPESARLLNQSPSFWVDRLGHDSAMAAAVHLQRDAGYMMTNLQILGQFVTSLHRMSSEMLSISVNLSVFPAAEVDRLSVLPQPQRAAKYMTAMGLWRPPSGPVIPGPLPVTSCTSCMNCESCFGRRGPTAQ